MQGNSVTKMGGSAGNSIEIWRIVFLYEMMSIHAYPLFLGYMEQFHITRGSNCVEFFFIVSGYLLAKKENDETDSFHYIWKRICRLFPLYFLAFLIAFFYKNLFFFHNGLKAILKEGLLNLDEVFMLQMAGLNHQSLYSNPHWFVSALLIVSFFVYWLYQRHRELYVKFLGPFLILVIYSIIYRYIGNLDIWAQTDGVFLNYALMRAFADISLGVICYEIVREFQISFTDSPSKRKFFYGFEVIGYFLVILICFRFGGNVADFAVALFLPILIAISFQHPIKHVPSFSKYTYSIFVNHFIIVEAIAYYTGYQKTISVAWYFFLMGFATVWGIAMYYFCKWCTSRMLKFYESVWNNHELKK